MDAPCLLTRITQHVYDVQIWDVGRMKQIRALKGHSARVSALAWSGTTPLQRRPRLQHHQPRCQVRA